MNNKLENQQVSDIFVNALTLWGKVKKPAKKQENEKFLNVLNELPTLVTKAVIILVTIGTDRFLFHP